MSLFFMSSALLRWTGHALVDVGIATLCAMARKSDPAALTLEDLDDAAEEMAEYYFNGVMGSYLTCVFPNAGYVNATMADEKRTEYKQRILYAHRSKSGTNTSDKICSFSGESATHLIDRAQLPLSTGAGILNFYPAASGGCYIAGPYLTALQALPLGGRRADGRLLIAHADAPEITLALAKRYLDDNRRYLGLASLSEGEDMERAKPWNSKYPDASAPRSLLLSDLTEILRQRSMIIEPSSVTGYWLTNFGERPALDIFTIPSSFVRFLERVGNENLTNTWNRMLRRGWNGNNPNGATDSSKTAKKKAITKKQTGTTGPGRSKNYVLEDLLNIFADGFVYPEAAQKFVRMHLLGAAGNTERLRSPKTWKLTELFLTEVAGMDRTRLEKIRIFADKIAGFIAEQNDRKLFNVLLFQAKKPWELRTALAKAQRTAAKSQNQLLFGLDEYYDVFEAEDAVGITRWDLVRDLIAIRVVENLHGLKWSNFKDVIEEEPEEDQAENAAVTQEAR
jgi:CRISPR-associated protein Cst1